MAEMEDEPQTDEKPNKGLSAEKAKKLLSKALELFKLDAEADHWNRVECESDLRFLHIPGEQWDSVIKTQRGERPCYEFNKLRVTVKRIVNDMRANRPAGKVRPVEDSDVELANVYEGLIRNIWNVSDGDTAIDHAAEWQVGGGMGAWRVRTDYADEMSFDQDICIETIKNPMCLYWDAAAQEPLKRDARHWFLTSMMSKEVYKAKYPNKTVVDFDGDNASRYDVESWSTDTQVRICEYWYKEPVTKTIAQMPDGKVIEVDKDELAKLPPGLRTKTVKTDQIKMCIISGDSVLEGPVDWVGKEFPFIVVFGEEIFLDGRNRWFGLTRFAKDSQRAYNASRTNAIESVSLTPLAKYWVTPAQVMGLEKQLAESHLKNYPYQIYNPDPKSPGPPQRMGTADVPVALIQEMQIASDDIKAVTGIFDNSLGKQANETSGVAIRSRQAQGEIATFNYMDNLSKGIRRTWEILVDIIPKIYDTPRAVRILGSDGAEDYVKLNAPDPITGEVENDLNRGKYDVAVTVGPSFSTQRQEASEIYGQMAQANPELYQIAGDLIIKATDLPFSKEIADRIKVMLPPPIQQMMNQDKPVPPEVQAMMQQAQAAMQQVQEHGQLVQKAAEDAQKEQADAKAAKADVEAKLSQIDVKLAGIKVEEAHLQTAVANFKTLVAETQAAMGDEQNAQNAAQDRQVLEQQMAEALSAIQAQAEGFQTNALQAIAEFHAAHAPQPRPRVVKMITTRQGGQAVHTPVYDDQATS